MIFVLVSMGMERGLAFGTLFTLDAREDAGEYPGQGAYLRFVDNQNVNNVLLTVAPTDPPFVSGSDVLNYASSKGLSNWLLTSAGNIWSSDLIVGESLSGLHAGIYRVSPVEGAYMYDSFGWNQTYKDKYWWELHIKASNGIYYMLGSFDGKTSAHSAFQAVQGSFIDIPLAEGSSLSFWLWDWNSIDNSGGLSFSVTPIPEPSTLTLLGIGMLFLIRRIRKLAH